MMPSVRQGLHERLQRGETIVAPGAYDPLSARVVQALGFSAVYTGGYMTGAHTAITEPLLTLTEQVDVAKKVVHAVELPVLTDAGAGYGDPLQTWPTHPCHQWGDKTAGSGGGLARGVGQLYASLSAMLYYIM